MSNSLVALWHNMLHFVYPRLCVSCDKTLLSEEETLCIECDGMLPATNYHHIEGNETEQRFEGRIKFEHATSLAYYTKEGLLQYLLQEFKYKGNKNVGSFLGKKLGAAIKKTDWAATIDLVVPVPLHSKKASTRGYNQSEIMAQEIACMLNIPVHTAGLIRIRNTDTQTSKSRSERAENMKDAFSLKDPSAFANKHILLLDDVLTTGATIEGCVMAMSAVEGLKISVATIGIASS